MGRAAGMVFAVLASGVVLFQLALAFGAPWGRLAMGGAVDGALPALEHPVNLGAPLEAAADRGAEGGVHARGVPAAREDRDAGLASAHAPSQPRRRDAEVTAQSSPSPRSPPATLGTKGECRPADVGLGAR